MSRGKFKIFFGTQKRPLGLLTHSDTPHDTPVDSQIDTPSGTAPEKERKSKSLRLPAKIGSRIFWKTG